MTVAHIAENIVLWLKAAAGIFAAVMVSKEVAKAIPAFCPIFVYVFIFHCYLLLAPEWVVADLIQGQVAVILKPVSYRRSAWPRRFVDVIHNHSVHLVKSLLSRISLCCEREINTESLPLIIFRLYIAPNPSAWVS